MYNNLLSTKFLYAMTALITGFVALLLKLMDAAMYFELVKWVGAIFTIGNVGSSAVEKIRPKE